MNSQSELFALIQTHV